MPRFQKKGKIASGGFGCVYEALRVEDNKRFAMKVFEGQNSSDEDLARFVREVRIQSQLRHPHIVPIVGSNLNRNPPCFIMPLASCNLSSKIADTSQRELKNVILIFTQLLEGIGYAHESGVIHRDLKPQNILFFPQEAEGGQIAKIGDFGLGKRLANESLAVTQSYQSFGTLPYMPPEQCEDSKRVDCRADIFALGKILYQMLTGKDPLHVILPNSSVPKAFGYVIEKCISVDPLDRYQSVGELKKDVLELAFNQRKFTHPKKRIEELISQLEANSCDLEATIDEVDQILVENLDDEAFFTRYFVTLGTGAIRAYLERNEAKFLSRLRDFDELVSGELAFAFTDSVANFYRSIWDAASNQQVRQLLLSRLVMMGYQHNRWHVGAVCGKMLLSITSQEEGMMARDILKSFEPAASWIRKYCEGGLLPVIKDGFVSDESQGDR